MQAIIMVLAAFASTLIVGCARRPQQDATPIPPWRDAATSCGDGKLQRDAGEECDGDEGIVDCATALRGPGGCKGDAGADLQVCSRLMKTKVNCTARCTRDTSPCRHCGDGRVDPYEQCDDSATDDPTSCLNCRWIDTPSNYSCERALDISPVGLLAPMTSDDPSGAEALAPYPVQFAVADEASAKLAAECSLTEDALAFFHVKIAAGMATVFSAGDHELAAWTHSDEGPCVRSGSRCAPAPDRGFASCNTSESGRKDIIVMVGGKATMDPAELRVGDVHLSEPSQSGADEFRLQPGWNQLRVGERGARVRVKLRRVAPTAAKVEVYTAEGAPVPAMDASGDASWSVYSDGCVLVYSDVGAVLQRPCGDETGSDAGCKPDCEPGLTACWDGLKLSCIDTAYDPRHCGSCEQACSERAHATAVCAAAECRFVCMSGFADCNLLPTDGCEADVEDAGHCEDHDAM